MKTKEKEQLLFDAENYFLNNYNEKLTDTNGFVGKLYDKYNDSYLTEFFDFDTKSCLECNNTNHKKIDIMVAHILNMCYEHNLAVVDRRSPFRFFVDFTQPAYNPYYKDFLELADKCVYCIRIVKVILYVEFLVEIDFGRRLSFVRKQGNE